MLAESTYWGVTIGLVVIAVVATLWVVTFLPSRRRARARYSAEERKATELLLKQRAELRMAPIRWEQERRRLEHDDWTQRVDAALDKMRVHWLDNNPGYPEVPKPVLDQLFVYAAEQVGPEPPR